MTIWKPIFWMLALGAVSVFIAFGLKADNTEKELQRIQTAGNAYYRIDRRIQTAVWVTGEYVAVDNMYQVLDKNSPASCSHYTAKKIQMIRKQLPYLTPLVAEYNRPVNGNDGLHVVVYVNYKGTIYLLDDNKRFLIKNPKLDALPGFQIMTLEQAQKLVAS